MGRIWISMARFVKIFFLGCHSLYGYFMLRSAPTLLLRGGQSRIQTGKLRSCLTRTSKNMNLMDTLEIKLETENHDCAILWFNVRSIKTWLIVGPISVENQIHLEHVSLSPSATCWIVGVFAVDQKFSCLQLVGWEKLARVDFDNVKSLALGVIVGDRIGVISGLAQWGVRSFVQLVQHRASAIVCITSIMLPFGIANAERQCPWQHSLCA